MFVVHLLPSFLTSAKIVSSVSMLTAHPDPRRHLGQESAKELITTCCSLLRDLLSG